MVKSSASIPFISTGSFTHRQILRPVIGQEDQDVILELLCGYVKFAVCDPDPISL